jgi:Uma2 family endonuclease
MVSPETRVSALQLPPRAGKYLQVVPDLVVEVLSRSTKTRDRGEKKAIYEANGVTEYWLVDLERRTLTVFAVDSDKVSRIGEQSRYQPPRVYRDGEQADTFLGVFPLAELLP